MISCVKSEISAKGIFFCWNVKWTILWICDLKNVLTVQLSTNTPAAKHTTIAGYN